MQSGLLLFLITLCTFQYSLSGASSLSDPVLGSETFPKIILLEPLPLDFFVFQFY